MTDFLDPATPLRETIDQWAQAHLVELAESGLSGLAVETADIGRGTVTLTRADGRRVCLSVPLDLAVDEVPDIIPLLGVSPTLLDAMHAVVGDEGYQPYDPDSGVLLEAGMRAYMEDHPAARAQFLAESVEELFRSWAAGARERLYRDGVQGTRYALDRTRAGLCRHQLFFRSPSGTDLGVLVVEHPSPEAAGPDFQGMATVSAELLGSAPMRLLGRALLPPKARDGSVDAYADRLLSVIQSRARLRALVGLTDRPPVPPGRRR